jgi:hypothetical protein
LTIEAKPPSELNKTPWLAYWFVSRAFARTADPGSESGADERLSKLIEVACDDGAVAKNTVTANPEITPQRHPKAQRERSV